jgi:hypothetical protein
LPEATAEKISGVIGPLPELGSKFGGDEEPTLSVNRLIGTQSGMETRIDN